jgi:hypothetical protein
LHIEAEPQVVTGCGYLPENVIGLSASLMKLEIRRAQLVCKDFSGEGNANHD